MTDSDSDYETDAGYGTPDEETSANEQTRYRSRSRLGHGIHAVHR